MGRVAPQRSAEQMLPTGETGRPIIAHIYGGPFDGTEQVLYRPQWVKSWRVKRGFVRRRVSSAPRYAWYELERAWRDNGIDHGQYVFRGLKSVPAPRD